jgi:signal transduction histidine kinase
MSSIDPFAKKKSFDNDIAFQLDDKENDKEKTIVYYGEGKTTEILLKTFSNAKEKWSVYANSKGPTISMGVNAIRKGYISLNKRGVKIQYITEINKNNLNYCKELQKISSLRHIDSAKGGMAVSESEYVATAVLKESKPNSHLIYSNVKEIVEQEQSIFDSLWKIAIPAEIKIKEIEEGIEPIETKVLDNKEDIFQKIELLSHNSEEILVAGEAGILQLIHDNLFECYQKILQKYEKGYHRGIRMIITISKDHSELVKLFMNLGIRIRHIQNPLPLNFFVTNRSFYTSVERIGKEGKMMENMIASNDPIYIHHFKTLFEDLWENGTDAIDIIKDIDRGLDPETIQVISRSSNTKDLYIKVIESAGNEIIILFPTLTAVKRQEKIGIIQKIEESITQKNVRVKILLPKDKHTEEIINTLKKNCKEHVDLIHIRYIEQMQKAKSTILIVDRNVSLLMEVKDDLKQNFIEAIGLSTFSNSKAGVLSYISIFENLWRITELLEELSSANQKLQKQDILQKEFVHIAAHELRNPIQPILALSQILKDYTNKYYKEQNNLLDVIYRNSKRLERLSGDILDMTRIESNILQLKKEKFDLDEFLNQVVTDYRYSLEKYHHHTNGEMENSIDLKYSHFSNDGIFLMVEWDKERLNQVIFNLLDNAFRFTKEATAVDKQKKGEIIVSCDVFNNDYAVVKVNDNGLGIDSEILPKLFTKFASKSKNGTGLGLYICKNIIESFGGRIWVENEGEGEGEGEDKDSNKNHHHHQQQQQQYDISKHDPITTNKNKGTTIAFSIPLVDSNLITSKNNKPKETETSNLKSSYQQNNNTQKKILIIDDEYDLTMTYKIGLESNGFIADTNNDPIDVLSEYKPDYYDLVLIDIRMPEMNGLELYNEIKKIDKNANICFITAYDTDNNTLKQIDMSSSSSKEIENICIIKKPIEIEKLIDLINKKIDKEKK